MFGLCVYAQIPLQKLIKSIFGSESMTPTHTSTRSLICSVLGHVDHGKSSLLDNIRSSNVVKGEAGGITQAIGASIIPLSTIKRRCETVLAALKTEITVPGLLFVDTPGHAAFTNLRKRGGNLADIAILVVDITEGMKPQTEESLDILRAHKTPFIIAANKVDKIPGWQSAQNTPLLKNIAQQSEGVRRVLDTKIYDLVGKLYEKGFQAERFDRVENLTTQLMIIPVSAVTGEGIPELLMTVIGLAQKYMAESLQFTKEGPAKGTILEVKESEGLGKTIDVILFDGTLKKGDTIVIGGFAEPIVTKVKALLEPKPLQEMRDTKTKYVQLTEAEAATGIKISAHDLDTVVAGMPLQSCTDATLAETKQEVQSQVEEVLITTENVGVVLKADTLGSLEALITLMREKGILIRKATLGEVNKKDIIDAASSKTEDETFVVVLGFNINVPKDVVAYAQENNVKIITSQVIYHLLDAYTQWKETKKKELEAKELEHVTKPCKIQILSGYIFRQNNPAVCGVAILEGELQTGVWLMKKDGTKVDHVKSLQKEKETVSEGKRGDNLAISLPNITIGRQLFEEDILYSMISEDEFRKLKDLKKYLSKEQKELLKEIAEIERRKNPMWGI